MKIQLTKSDPIRQGDKSITPHANKGCERQREEIILQANSNTQ